MRTWKIVAIAGIALIAGTSVLGILGLVLLKGPLPAGLPPPGEMFLLGPAPWPAPHGVLGRVEEVDPVARTIVVANRRGERRLLLLRDDTVLERRHRRIDLLAIKTGDHVVAIGSPQGKDRLLARAIGILEPRPSGPPTLFRAAAESVFRALRLLPPWLRWFLWRFEYA